MCGIFCLISQSTDCESTELHTQFSALFERNILRRGPDNFNSKQIKCDDTDLFFAASVLWLQGKKMTSQPLETEEALLIYNGDIFGGSISDNERSEMGDTRLFMNSISNLEEIQGPYAFIYYNFKEKRIDFGRDHYGRRSLLLGKNGDQFIITSVARKGTEYDFIELPAIGTFSYDLSSNSWIVHPWKRRNRNFANKLTELETFLGVHFAIIPDDDVIESLDAFQPPQDQDLGILNAYKSEKYNFDFLLTNPTWLNKVIKIEGLLEEAVTRRISTQPQFCKNCIEKRTNCKHSLTGVLFSGGVDCSILALLADKSTHKDRPIDLINVAFEGKENFMTPDRVTALETLKELRALCPNRTWNFVPVNVTIEELNQARRDVIADLIHPLNTVLDDSLGCALWFASRAETKEYKSPSRVLLVGMGADEIFGGYMRHRSALWRVGWDGLHASLEEDWQNLPHRNLGRDDRVVSDHGRQLRTPYLDENLVRYSKNLNSWEKSWPLRQIPLGFGEKILLRTVAHHLGLKGAACFKKRALQFGSRIANPKENAHEVTDRLVGK